MSWRITFDDLAREPTYRRGVTLAAGLIAALAIDRAIIWWLPTYDELQGVGAAALLAIEVVDLAAMFYFAVMIAGWFVYRAASETGTFPLGLIAVAVGLVLVPVLLALSRRRGDLGDAMVALTAIGWFLVLPAGIQDLRTIAGRSPNPLVKVALAGIIVAGIAYPAVVWWLFLA